MSRTDKIIQQVSSSMAMEGLPLSAADQERIRVCLTEPEKLEQMIAELLKKHAVYAS